MQPYIEQDCTFTHDGHTFEAAGAVITPHKAVAYTGNDPMPKPTKLRSGTQFFPSRPSPAACGTPWHGTLTDWHGNKLGTFTIKSRRYNPRGVASLHTYYISARINGRDYYGTTQGEGMVTFLTAYKGQD